MLRTEKSAEPAVHGAGRIVARAIVRVVVGLTLGCQDAASAILPETPLGTVARAWLFAHNQGDGHALVHFTLENRGAARISGAQVDSTVYDGVRFARAVGPLTPVRLLHSTDTSLVILLRSPNGEVWKAQFKPAPQPGPVKVRVQVGRA